MEEEIEALLKWVNPIAYELPISLIVKLQTQSEGLGVDFTFAMEQEQQEQQEQEQASPKFLGWDGTRGLKFGNLT